MINANVPCTRCMLYRHAAASATFSVRARAPLPLSAFLFERTAIFTATAEYIGDLRDKTGEHGLQHDYRRRQQITSTDNRDIQTVHTHAYIHTHAWHVFREIRLPLAVLFLVRAAVFAPRAKNVHYLGYEACKHRLETERNSINGVRIVRGLQPQSASAVALIAALPANELCSPLWTVDHTSTVNCHRLPSFYAGSKLYCIMAEAQGCEQLRQNCYSSVPDRKSKPRIFAHESYTLPSSHHASQTKHHVGCILGWNWDI